MAYGFFKTYGWQRFLIKHNNDESNNQPFFLLRSIEHFTTCFFF